MDYKKLKFEILTIVQKNVEKNNDIKNWRKKDNSFVTNIDLEISQLFEEICDDSINFYSEESYSNLKFPSVILDPIDGTKGLIDKTFECSVSFALMNSQYLNDPLNKAWIFNPFNNFELSLGNVIMANSNKTKFKILVSRSEYEAGLFERFQNLLNLEIKPMGSIAYKLALLAKGECDLVISFRSKNIWDIAAGSILCNKAGINYYQSHGIVDNLSSKEYEAPQLWCRPDVFDKVGFLFFNAGTNVF